MVSFGYRLAQSIQIIEDAIFEHKPVGIFASFSGGKDSVVITDIFYRWVSKQALAAQCGTIAILTGLQADGWESWVRDYCDRHNWPVEFITGDGQKWYTQQVQKYGFGFSRSHHTNLYRYLKQHAIQRHIQTVKVGHFDRVMYLTGVRRSESTSRQNTKIVYRNGARVGVNPLIYWTDEDIDLYINTLLPDYDNPFYEIYGGSGDCYCGWTCTHRVEDFEKESPRLFNYLSTLNKTQIACGLWKYGEVPTKEQKQLVAELQNEEMPPDALCANCSIAAKTKILT